MPATATGPLAQSSKANHTIREFLVLVCHTAATYPLSTVVIGGRQSDWVSANRRVAVWTWPCRLFAPEESLKLQLGGHGAGKGPHVAIDIDALGRGSVSQDSFGLAPLYVATCRDFTIVANRPPLVASVWQRMVGRSPERDPIFGALLAFTGFPVGNRTGYRDVRCVPFEARLRVTPDRVDVRESGTPPWNKLEPAPTSVKASQDAIDEVEALLVADMRHVVSAAAANSGKPALQLTGGRDSRLTLALALRSDVARDLDVITHGDRRTPDARTARRVARAAGVRHTLHEWFNTPHDPFGHVRKTSGALNLREACAPPEAFRHTLIVSGLMGETFRSNFPTTEPLKTRGLVLRTFFGQSSLDLLTEDAWLDVVVEAMQLLMSPLDHGASAEDLQDAFYLQHRIRRWISVRPDAFLGTHFPLYCPRAVHLAFALGRQARVRNVIHDGIIARAGHGLSRIEYAGPKQPRRPSPCEFSYPEDGPPVLDREILLGIARSWREMRPRWQPPREHARPPRETAKRIGLYRQILGAKHDNPAFDFIDKGRLSGAIRNLPGMPIHLANQVHGAMASVIWLGGLEASTPAMIRPH